MVEIFEESNYKKNKITKFHKTENGFYSPRERIFNRDFVNMLALTITIPTMICFGIGNYLSYSKTKENLSYYGSSHLKSEILNSEYTGVKGLDNIIKTYGVLPGFELALKNNWK